MFIHSIDGYFMITPYMAMSLYDIHENGKSVKSKPTKMVHFNLAEGGIVAVP